MKDYYLEYERFHIPSEKIPVYENNPEEFARKLKRCSLYKFANTYYSNSTSSVGEEKKQQGK